MFRHVNMISYRTGCIIVSGFLIFRFNLSFTFTYHRLASCVVTMSATTCIICGVFFLNNGTWILSCLGWGSSCTHFSFVYVKAGFPSFVNLFVALNFCLDYTFIDGSVAKYKGRKSRISVIWRIVLQNNHNTKL